MLTISLTTASVVRGLLGQKVARKAFLWHPSGNTWFVDYWKDVIFIGTLLPKKVLKRKACQTQKNQVTEILNSTTTKMTGIIRENIKSCIPI